MPTHGQLREAIAANKRWFGRPKGLSALSWTGKTDKYGAGKGRILRRWKQQNGLWFFLRVSAFICGERFGFSPAENYRSKPNFSMGQYPNTALP
jgi:hypothetical protein